jgi:hypothetical protein
MDKNYLSDDDLENVSGGILGPSGLAPEGYYYYVCETCHTFWCSDDGSLSIIDKCGHPMECVDRVFDCSGYTKLLNSDLW